MVHLYSHLYFAQLKTLPNAILDCVRTESNMEPSVITKGRYTYVRDSKAPPAAIDVHHIIVSRSAGGSCIFCTYALLFAIIGLLILTILQNTTSVFQVLMPDKPVASFLGSITLAGFFLRQLLRSQVEKESVVILPAFGVQLETTYKRKTVRHFVPIGKILKPVLNECVTPVTCYWSLSLILRGEDELLPVFKELYPPVTIGYQTLTESGATASRGIEGQRPTEVATIRQKRSGAVRDGVCLSVEAVKLSDRLCLKKPKLSEKPPSASPTEIGKDNAESYLEDLLAV
ncbi:hypothetical protein PHJA_002193500 [Phtheirospermum japonicum]|uniref:Phosphatidylinositol N-acetylglucosaminyltransferase subunit H conserved domain-containing protein n=1 Tax=Phtheirospermum japonicum TaxID=374723 RepID=A0A830CWF3_9LAMI|nr:hypothetical protein PHJA_002193500 [Phtheirospermum japonicum]